MAAQPRLPNPKYGFKALQILHRYIWFSFHFPESWRSLAVNKRHWLVTFANILSEPRIYIASNCCRLSLCLCNLHCTPCLHVNSTKMHNFFDISLQQEVANYSCSMGCAMSLGILSSFLCFPMGGSNFPYYRWWFEPNLVQVLDCYYLRLWCARIRSDQSGHDIERYLAGESFPILVQIPPPH